MHVFRSRDREPHPQEGRGRGARGDVCGAPEVRRLARLDPDRVARSARVQIGVLLAVLAITATLTGLGGATRATAESSSPTGAFQDYLLFTNFETLDPGVPGTPAGGCVGRYYSEWVGKYQCTRILDNGSVEGPMHTNDAANLDGRASFGRAGVSPPDTVEIYGGTYPEDGGERCTGKPVFHTATGCYIKGKKLLMPEGDSSLAAIVESEYEFSGETRLELNGNANAIHVAKFNAKGEESGETLGWPRNGLIYVRSGVCGWPTSSSTEASNADGATEAQHEKGCGNVYVRGTYSRPLTIAAEDDVIINGSVYPNSVAGHLGEVPGGTATLGLIAGNYVRIYHPVSATGTDAREQACTATGLGEAEDPNKWGSQPNIWIYAAILAIAHSFIVDNYSCGPELGVLNLYGAIAENYRGPTGTSGEKESSGYTKDYKYDDLLASNPPPYYLTPAPNDCSLSESTIALSGASGARRKPFTVKIGSLGIREITFYLDGRELRTLTAAQAKGPNYAVRVDPRKLSHGPHTVSVSTVMDNAACTPIARSSVFVRPRTTHLVPRFTG